MKKVSVLLLMFVLGVVFKGYSQTTPSADYFAGKWEIIVTGTPNGDAKFATELIRKDGKLTGELSTPADPTQPRIPITSIEESADKVVIYFSTQGYDINLSLAKVDGDTLKGSMMDMFDASGKRVN